MPSPVELTLVNLLPTVNFLPPELIELSNSLLAQSRAKAASLRPDEEVARTYACCHIACERLANKLDLELSKPAPPVKPKIYAKLKAYLDSALKAAASAPATPKTPSGRLRSVAKTPTSRASIGARPSIQARTPSKVLKTSSKPLAASQQHSPLPQFVTELVRSLSNRYNCDEAVLHVLAGVGSIYRVVRVSQSQSQRSEEPLSAKRRKSSSQTTHLGLGIDQMLPVLTTVLFWRVKQLLGGDEEFMSSYKTEHDKLMLFVIDFYDNNPQIFADGPNAKQIDDSFEYWAEEAVRTWSQSEWYGNITNPGATGESEPTAGNSDPKEHQPYKRPARTPLGRRKRRDLENDDDDDEAVENRAGLLPGLGTMFQPAIDWLSEERCIEFESWKADLMREIDAKEAEGQLQAVAAA